MLDRRTSVEEAVDRFVRSGQRIMVGGFGRGGTPFTIIRHLADQPERIGKLTIIKNDANEPGLGVDLLFKSGQVDAVISTHIGLNPEFIAQMNAGEIACELIPQGIFAEKIRAGGAGIPAFLSDIGVGTEVEKGREVVEFRGGRYLLEEALRGDVALIRADVADPAGNCWWRGSNRNMCVVMGTACDRVIVEAREIAQIVPENVHLPSVFVDAVVPSGPLPHVEAP